MERVQGGGGDPFDPLAVRLSNSDQGFFSKGSAADLIVFGVLYGIYSIVSSPPRRPDQTYGRLLLTLPILS